MADERDDLLREIGDAIAVEPSVEFAAKVRQAIDARGRSRSWRALWFAMPAAAVVMLGVTMAISWRATSAPVPAVAVSAPPAPVVPAPAMPAAVTTAPRPRTLVTAPTVQATPAASSGLDLRPLVPGEQAVLLRHILISVREQRAAVPPPVQLFDADGAILAPPPLETKPITVELLPGSVPDGSRREDR